MKIGIDVTGIHENKKTGTEVFITNFINELSKDTKNKYVLYSYFELKKEIKLPQNFSIKVCGLRLPAIKAVLMFFFWNSLLLPYYIKRDKLDLFISTNQMGPLFCHTDYMMIIHDLSFATVRKCFTIRDQIIYNFFAKISVKRAKKIFADSIATKNDILNIYNISNNNVEVVYLGYDKDRFNTKSNTELIPVKKKYSIFYKYIIFVGTLQKRKNIRRLIEAYYLLKSSKKIDCKLIVCGKKGWLYGDIFDFVKKHNLDQDVIFLGFVPDSDIASLIASADMFVLPSLYEGFGIPLLEAMAVGTPVITSQISSLPEVVGSAGLLIKNPTSIDEIAEKILLLTKSSSLRDSLRQKGLARVKRFDWTIAGEKYRRIINMNLNEN